MYTPILHQEKKTALYIALYQAIRLDILRKQLRAGERLPSKRQLASGLGISVNTVDNAYQQLVSEGYLEVRAQSGHYVKPLGEHALLPDIAVPSPDREKPLILEQANDDTPSGRIDFSPIGTDLTQFPTNIVKKALRKELDTEKEQAFRSCPPAGSYRLRNALCRYLANSRGLHCRPEQILIGAGTDYVLQLFIQILRLLHRDPETARDTSGPVLAMEDPVYSKAYRIFSGLSVPVHFVPLDRVGIDIDILRQSPANLVYTTPSHQFPLGLIMPADRRLQLLAWANEKDNRFIIEDDYDSEYRYLGKPIPPIGSLDSNGRVIYLGTFSKALSPSIRVSYLILPEKLLRLYEQHLSYYSNTVTHLEQLMLANLLETGEFERQINRSRTLCRKKRDLLLQALSPYSRHLHIRGTDAGTHLLCTVRNKMTEEELITAARKAGVIVYGISDYYIDTSVHLLPYQMIPDATVLLGYAGLSESELYPGAARLAQAWKIERKKNALTCQSTQDVL